MLAAHDRVNAYDARCRRLILGNWASANKSSGKPTQACSALQDVGGVRLLGLGPATYHPSNLPTRPLFWLSRSGCRRGRLIGRAKVGRQLLKHAGRREVLTAR